MRLSLSTSTVRRSSESPHLTHTHFPRSPAPAQRTATDSMRAFAQTGSWSILAFKGDPGGLQMTLAAAGGGGCKDVAGMIVAGGCRSQASYLQSLRQRVSSRLELQPIDFLLALCNARCLAYLAYSAIRPVSGACGAPPHCGCDNSSGSGPESCPSHHPSDVGPAMDAESPDRNGFSALNLQPLGSTSLQPRSFETDWYP